MNDSQDCRRNVLLVVPGVVGGLVCLRSLGSPGLGSSCVGSSRQVRSSLSQDAWLDVSQVQAGGGVEEVAVYGRVGGLNGHHVV